DHARREFELGVVPGAVLGEGDLASGVVDMEVYGRPDDYFDRYRENIASITEDHIGRVAEKYIDTERALIVIVGNANQIREPLGTLGIPLHEIDIEGQFVTA